MPKTILAGVLGLGLVFVFITAALPYVGMNIDFLHDLLAKDPFAIASLSAEVSWSWWNGLPALLMLVTILSFTFMWKKDIQKGLKILFIGTILFVNSILFLNINNIEAYSQRALIEFCKEHANEKAYIKFIGTKSYAPLFYGLKAMDENPKSNDKNWLLESNDLDRDAYIIVKIHKALDLNEYPKLKELYRKNGFIFYKRTI